MLAQPVCVGPQVFPALDGPLSLPHDADFRDGERHGSARVEQPMGLVDQGPEAAGNVLAQVVVDDQLEVRFPKMGKSSGSRSFRHASCRY